MQKTKRIKLTVISIFLITSCVTVADYNFHNIDKAISINDFESVHFELENPNGLLYTSKDSVLENLDKGIISHYAGEYQRSNQELEKAEKLMEKFQAASVTQAIGSMMVNDTVMDYAGDPYEDIYTNIFMALNYMQMNNFEDAFVEIRRMDNKLKGLSVKYKKEIDKQKLSLSENSTSVPKGDIKFHNSAFARYLSMLMYRSEGDYDNAEVDYKYIQQAFKLQASLYDFTVPECIAEDFKKPAEARLNVVCFGGRAPLKHEEMLPLFAVDGFYRIAMPIMLPRETVVSGAKITATNVETGAVYTTNSEKLESIQNIAMDTYNGKYSVIVARTIGRMVARLTTTIALDVAADKVEDPGLSLLFSLAGLVSKVNMFASERADVRTSRYFPNNVYVAGLDLPAGTYDVKVQYLNKKHHIESETFRKTIKAADLNLIESYCLR